MNSELKGAITMVLIIVALILISFIGDSIICMLVIFDVIKTPLIVKILVYIINVLTSVFFGMFILYSIKGGNK